MKTVITYTPIGNSVAKPKALVQPPHIDDVQWPNTPNAVTHRYESQLQNTFLLSDVIVAVWTLGMYMGIVEERS